MTTPAKHSEEIMKSLGKSIEAMKPTQKKHELQIRYAQLSSELERTRHAQQQLMLDARARLIAVETTSPSWLQNNWRPMLMIIYMFIILNNYILAPYFKLPPSHLDDHIWNLMEIGITGYVAGRSLEKISEQWGWMRKGKR